MVPDAMVQAVAACSAWDTGFGICCNALVVCLKDFLYTSFNNMPCNAAELNLRIIHTDQLQGIVGQFAECEPGVRKMRIAGSMYCTAAEYTKGE